MPERLSAAEAAAPARRMRTLFEPVHVVSYFAAEPRAAFEQAGLRGYWRGYFAGRTAPLGAADMAAARPWSQLTRARAAELAELLRPVARARAEALPFPSDRSAEANGQLTTHPGTEPS